MSALLVVTACLAGLGGFLIGCVLAAGTIADLREDKRKLIAYIDYIEGGGDLDDEYRDLLREPRS